MGPGAGEHGGHVVAEGTAEEVEKQQGLGHGAVPLREAGDRHPGPAHRGPRLVLGARRDAAQPEVDRRRVPGREVRLRHRRVRIGQVHARQRDRLQGAREPAAPDAREAGRARELRGDRVLRQGDRHRPVADRADAAVEPGDLHRRSSTHIRELYSLTPEAKVRGYKPGRFSFNVRGGRCETCKGDGTIKIEMHFLPDVYVPCETCHGRRYNRETLEVRFKGKSIADVLEMSVEEALRFFAKIPKLRRRLQTLHDVGLDYIKLGQPATTLSGGEAQRVKLAVGAVQDRDRADAVHPRRADDRPALRGHREAARGAPAARRRGQHRARDRAQPRRDQAGGLDHRPRARGRRGGRRGDRDGHAGAGGRGRGVVRPASSCASVLPKKRGAASPPGRGLAVQRKALGPVPALVRVLGERGTPSRRAPRSAGAARGRPRPRPGAPRPPRRRSGAGSPRRESSYGGSSGYVAATSSIKALNGSAGSGASQATAGKRATRGWSNENAGCEAKSRFRSSRRSSSSRSAVRTGRGS